MIKQMSTLEQINYFAYFQLHIIFAYMKQSKQISKQYQNNYKQNSNPRTMRKKIQKQQSILQAKQKVRSDFAISPRCLTNRQSGSLRCSRTTSPYSWKNYLRQDVDDHYEKQKTKRTSRNIMNEQEIYGIQPHRSRMSQQQYSSINQKKFAESSVGYSVDLVDMGTNTSSPKLKIQTYKSISSKYNQYLEEKNYDSDNLATIISGQSFEVLSEANFKRKHRNIFSDQRDSRYNQLDDDYHRRLREEQRLYLLRKFMKHIEGIHHVKL